MRDHTTLTLGRSIERSSRALRVSDAHTLGPAHTTQSRKPVAAEMKESHLTPVDYVDALGPPSLGKILECQALEAFHPHPNLPIYTDADKGHVQIGDLPLEIVDLWFEFWFLRLRILLILEVPEGSSSIYPHSEADSDVEEVEEGEGVADAAKTVAGNDEPIPESPKTPKLHPAALPPSQSPGRRSPVSPKSKLPSVGVSTGLLGWDKFGAPGPDRGHSYSDKDENSSRDVEDGNSLENFVDAGNEGYNGRHSLKSASHRLLSTLATRASYYLPLPVNRRTQTIRAQVVAR
ncbi:hypothetical protein DFH94DRAFT_802855 [Russula ochroleuca]|uniref:Uncharacterized protein n=1 Tax=Russula ochroleuca TaxID=152965 RepID=A0A9P5T6C6_9AGAM|nr:hypothetical protein DFH94DRAFT_802855 [Russula ochroleuca]